MDPFSIFAAIAAISSLFGVSESMQAASAQKKAQRSQQEQQNMRFAMERRQTIRQSRIAQAVAMQNAENQGVGGSSGAAGGQGSIISQGNQNLQFLDGSNALAKQIGSFLDNAASHQSNAAGWGALSQLAQIGMGYGEAPSWLTGKTAETPKFPMQTPTKPGSPMGGMRDVANNIASLQRTYNF